MPETLLKVENLKKHFPIKRGLFSKVAGKVYAVDGISLGIHRRQTLGLVGESGSGKSTLAKTLLGIHPPDEGGEGDERALGDAHGAAPPCVRCGARRRPRLGDDTRCARGLRAVVDDNPMRPDVAVRHRLRAHAPARVAAPPSRIEGPLQLRAASHSLIDRRC